MLIKRILFLGITIIGSGWTTRTQADNPFYEGGGKTDAPKELAGKHFSPASSPAALADSESRNEFNELFAATSIGGSNGARLNPRALSFVQDYIKENRDELQGMRTWGRPYFNIIDGILAQYGLPRELKYLAVIESNLKPTAVSWVGAVGPWQLMPQTARDLGLKVARGNDERKNYYKSTRAAALYLRDLYNELGDWLLVIAAYNGGTNNVYHAIRRSGSHNFWDLQYYLPA
jgi:membrane-bound lytic murein transglycosylase D